MTKHAPSSPRTPAADTVDAFYGRLRQEIREEYPELDILSSELVFNLIRAFSGLQNRLGQAAQPHGLTMSGCNVLTILNYHRQGMPLNELGGLLLVSRANVTGLIDSLERKGLVERVDHESDRRVFLARITPAGIKVLKAYRPAHLASTKELGAALSAAEKKTLIQLLGKMSRGIESNR